MNDPQIWTMIGVFSAITFGLNRQLLSSLRRELDARLATTDARIEGLEARMDARFTDLEHRLESLEGDMHLVKAHLIGGGRATPVRG